MHPVPTHTVRCASVNVFWAGRGRGSPSRPHTVSCAAAHQHVHHQDRHQDEEEGEDHERHRPVERRVHEVRVIAVALLRVGRAQVVLREEDVGEVELADHHDEGLREGAAKRVERVLGGGGEDRETKLAFDIKTKTKNIYTLSGNVRLCSVPIVPPPPKKHKKNTIGRLASITFEIVN